MFGGFDERHPPGGAWVPTAQATRARAPPPRGWNDLARSCCTTSTSSWPRLHRRRAHPRGVDGVARPPRCPRWSTSPCSCAASAAAPTRYDDVAARPYGSVIILGYRDSASPAEADAKTCSPCCCSTARCRRSSRRPRIVTELLDARDVDLAVVTGADDFVVSGALASLMMAQLAERAELHDVFTDPFDSGLLRCRCTRSAGTSPPGRRPSPTSWPRRRTGAKWPSATG